MTLATSNHKYDILSFWELTEKQQEKARRAFDWVEDIDSSHGYFIYKKEVYNLWDFFRNYQILTDEKTGRKFYSHGISNWSAFNGLAVQFVHNDSMLKIAYYY
jgi:hypothetical protein